MYVMCFSNVGIQRLSALLNEHSCGSSPEAHLARMVCRVRVRVRVRVGVRVLGLWLGLGLG